MASVKGASAMASEPTNISPSPIADGERAALARDDHQIVVAAKIMASAKAPFEPLQRVVDGAHRIVAGLQLAGDEMGDDLGVGVAGEHRAVARSARPSARGNSR